MSARRRFRPPLYRDNRDPSSWRLNVGADERAVVAQMIGELRELLTADGTSEVDAALRRLFPPAYVDDEDKEAEYQRLMRDELLESRLSQLEVVAEFLEPDGPDRLDERQVVALMQSLNAVRIVLGTMLDVDEDDDVDPADADDPTRQLYGFLSWLLDWTVRSMSA